MAQPLNFLCQGQRPRRNFVKEDVSLKQKFQMSLVFTFMTLMVIFEQNIETDLASIEIPIQNESRSISAIGPAEIIADAAKPIKIDWDSIYKAAVTKKDDKTCCLIK
jgi:hypothetical protein